MGFFDHDDYRERRHHDDVYGCNDGSLTHEAIAGAASFAAMRAYENHERDNGRPRSWALGKELIAGFAGAEADKLVETRGFDHIDRERARHDAREQSKYALGQSGCYGQQDYQQQAWGGSDCGSGGGWDNGNGNGWDNNNNNNNNNNGGGWGNNSGGGGYDSNQGGGYGGGGYGDNQGFAAGFNGNDDQGFVAGYNDNQGGGGYGGGYDNQQGGWGGQQGGGGYGGGGHESRRQRRENNNNGW